MFRKSHFVAIAGLSLLIVSLAGCSKEITVSQYPAFYDLNIKTIAVVPFRNESGVEGAGNIISDKLATMLMTNGTYTHVYNRNDIGVLSDERDLQLGLGKDPAKVEAMFSKLGDIDAILTGVVTTYAATSNSQQRQDPIYQYNPNTRTSYIAGYRTYVYTRNEANVSASATLLRRDGTAIHATSYPAQAQAYAEGSPPSKDVFALLSQSANIVAGQLVEEFAVVRKVIKVDPNKTIRTASELFEGEWTFKDRFPASSKLMYVVVELPHSADRNNFTIRITRKDQREYLVEKEITWDGKYKSLGYDFNVEEIAQKGGGKGTYTVKFYSGPAPVIMRDFRVE